jgi:hypothetical protein
MIGSKADFPTRPCETGSGFSLFLIRTGEQPMMSREWIGVELEGSAVNLHRIRGSSAASIGRSPTKASMWNFSDGLSGP